MINLENKIERDKLIDDYFNKGYACDIREVYQAVVNTIADLEYANDEKIKEIERLNIELEIYKLRHKLALRKLNSAIRHYDTDKENNAIIYTKQILEGQGIEEKCHNMLRK